MPKSIKGSSAGAASSIGRSQTPASSSLSKKSSSLVKRGAASSSSSSSAPPPLPIVPSSASTPSLGESNRPGLPQSSFSASSSRTSPASPSFPSIAATTTPQQRRQRQSSRDDGDAAEFDPSASTPSSSSSNHHIFGSSSSTSTPGHHHGGGGGSGSGGFRSNFMRSVRDRSGTIKEADDDKARKLNSSTPGPFFGGGRSRNKHAEKANGSAGSGSRGESSTTKKLNGASEPRSPSLEEEKSTIEPETWKEKRRGSMIKNLGHKAKGVLPMKRSTRDRTTNGSGESSSTLAVKPSTSSLQSAQSGHGQTRYTDTTSESDGDVEEDQDDDETLKGRIATSSSRDLRLPLQSPTSESSPRSPTSLMNGKAAVRPKSVPTRISSSDAVAQSSSSSSHHEMPLPLPPQQHQGVVKRSNKIMQMPPEDLADPLPLKSRQLGPSSVEQSRRMTASSHHTTSASLRSVRPFPSTTSLESSSAGGMKSPRIRSASQPDARPAAAPRSTSAIKLSSRPTTSTKPSTSTTIRPLGSAKPRTTSPPLPSTTTHPKLDPAPPNGMYWSVAPAFGSAPGSIRAHTSTLVGSSIYVFGGCDARTCFNDLWVFDCECLCWSHPTCSGEAPPPLRAMTTTAVGKKLVIFGGGDGPSYYNDVYVLDTVNFRYAKPEFPTGAPMPAKRRAHAACLYKNGIYVFGGGDGGKALNDVWRLDVSDLSRPSWSLVCAASSGTVPSAGLDSPSAAAANGAPPPVVTASKLTSSTKHKATPSASSTSYPAPPQPTARGYHTANVVGSKLIIYGGSDGSECFRDVWVLDIESAAAGWKRVEMKTSFARLSHSATVVGSYLLVMGGHDGVEYSCDVLLLNLVTMSWDRRKCYGRPPSGRGYHGAVLCDSRLWVLGGFDGHTVFDDTYMLELAVSAYYSQISHFSIDV